VPVPAVATHRSFSDTNELTLGEYFYESDTTLKGLSRRGLRHAHSRVHDLKPIQAQIDDLKSQVSKLQGDTARASSDAAAAHAAAIALNRGFRRAEHGEQALSTRRQIRPLSKRSREDRSHVQEVCLEESSS